MRAVGDRHILAVSPDPGFAAQLEAALAPLGDVEIHATLEAATSPELATLCVIHFTHDPALAALARLPPTCRIIAILPRATLAAFVDIMRSSERVVGMLSADDFEAHHLTTMAARCLAGGNGFGLAAVMPPGTQIHELRCSYADRRRCSATVYAFLVASGIARKHHAGIEQCVDEMLMNALYDAPVDEQGAPVFAGVPVRERVRLGIAHEAVVQYALRGEQFAVSVRDAFGSLDRLAVLRVLHKCLHAAQKIDRKAGGAGVGLYLMVSAASAVYFSVVPGVATEVICTFALDAPAPQLARFGFFAETLDATSTLVPHPRTPETLRPVALQRTWTAGRMLALGAAIAATATVLALGVLPRIFGRSPDVPAEPAALSLESQPTGATVELDGEPLGATPLTVTTLEPGTQVSLVFKRVGYRDARASLHVPARGETAQHVQALERDERYVLVRLTSTPAGAQVVRLDDAEASAARTYTPAELFVEAETPQRFMLTMPGRVPVVFEPFTPTRGQDVIEKSGTLERGITLRVTGSAGEVSVSGAAHCQQLAVPADCTLAAGRYEIEYRGAAELRETRTVELADADVTVTFGSER